MNRRDFVHGSAVALVGFLAWPFSLKTEATSGPVRFGGHWFRIGEGGRVHVSTNGRQWSTATDFGAERQPVALFPQGRHLCARLRYRQVEFLLKTTDGQQWVPA